VLVIDDDDNGCPTAVIRALRRSRHIGRLRLCHLAFPHAQQIPITFPRIIFSNNVEYCIYTVHRELDNQGIYYQHDKCFRTVYNLSYIGGSAGEALCSSSPTMMTGVRPSGKRRREFSHISGSPPALTGKAGAEKGGEY
jgi:hypothetical protein